MKKLLIEIEIPGAGTLTAEQSKEFSGVSHGVLCQMGTYLLTKISTIIDPITVG